MLAEHGMAARDYKDVRANTVPAFALGDYEWILAFEAPELHRIVDLMRDLRATDARRHVREETPFFTGPRVGVEELVAKLPEGHVGQRGVAQEERAGEVHGERVVPVAIRHHCNHLVDGDARPAVSFQQVGYKLVGSVTVAVIANRHRCALIGRGCWRSPRRCLGSRRWYRNHPGKFSVPRVRRAGLYSIHLS